MNMISLIVGVALIGFIVWIVLQIPMPEIFKKIIVAIVCVFLILWALQMLGVHIALPTLRFK